MKRTLLAIGLVKKKTGCGYGATDASSGIVGAGMLLLAGRRRTKRKESV